MEEKTEDFCDVLVDEEVEWMDVLGWDEGEGAWYGVGAPAKPYDACRCASAMG